MELINLLIDGLKEFGIEAGGNKIKNLLDYKDMVIEWNKKINLTAIEDDRDFMIKHFLDSASILRYIGNKKTKLIDIGTGAGFPGIPLKILNDEIDVTLFDSLDKRVKFLDEVIRTLELKGIRALHGRAEEYGVKPDHREKYQIAVARAVANLPVLLEYCLPFVETEGLFIAMKGSNTDEIGSSDKALDILGGKLEDVKEITLPYSDIKRNIIFIRKLRHTPTKYPRKSGKPSKDPLV